MSRTGGDALNVDFSLEPWILVAGLAIAIVTGFATGIAPALQATRPDTLPALKDETSVRVRGDRVSAKD